MKRVEPCCRWNPVGKHSHSTLVTRRSGCGTDAEYCRDPGDQPHGDQGDHPSRDPAETKLVV